MNLRWNAEFWVGIFVISGFLAFAYIAIKLGGISFLYKDHYTIYAEFSTVSGLKEGAIAEIAGVNIGKVRKIELTNDDMARIELLIKSDVKLQSDVIISVRTQGIIGDKYIKIKPGSSDTFLKPGEKVIDTESAIDLEEIISKYIFGKI